MDESIIRQMHNLIADAKDTIGERPTLRDQFAMAALKGLLSNSLLAESLSQHSDNPDSTARYVAKSAGRFADAMMEERKK